MSTSVTIVYRIYAAIQPKKRAKWVQMVIEYDESAEMSLEEAMKEANQMQRDLEAEHPGWTNGNCGVVHNTVWREA